MFAESSKKRGIMKRKLVVLLILMDVSIKMPASEKQELVQQIKELDAMKAEDILIRKEIKILEDKRDLQSLNSTRQNPDLAKKTTEDINGKIDALEYRLDIVTGQIKIAQLKEKLEQERIALSQLKSNDKQKNSTMETIRKIQNEIDLIEKKLAKLQASEDREIQIKKIRYKIIEGEREKNKLATSNNEEDKKRIKEIESDNSSREIMIDVRKPTIYEKQQRKKSYLKNQNIE